MTKYQVVNQWNSAIPAEVISSHDTMEEAEAAFYERNPHLADPEWAKRHGMANAGTFDRIEEVEG